MVPWPEDRPHPMFGDARHVLVNMNRTHRPVHVRPSGDPSLAYVLFVPAGWQAALDLPAQSSGSRSDIIGLFAADDSDDAPRLVVRASRPQWEIDPLEWVRTSLILSGWRIAIARWLDQPEGRFEIGAVKSGERGLEIRRCIGFLDGGRIVRVDTSAPAPRWRGVHDLIWPCGMLLELDEPTEQARVENWRVHEGPLMRFSLPGSWAATGLPREGTRSVRWIADIADGAQADAGVRIDVSDGRSIAGRAGASVDERQAAVREDLRTRGLTLSRRMDRLPPADDPGTGLPGWQGAWAGEAVDPAGERHEVRLGHRDLGETRVDYLMLAPPRGTHHLDWMRATRAFAIAVTSSTPAPARP